LWSRLGAVRPFFGSWYDLQGYKQTGYFLGHELVKALTASKSLREVALLQDYARLLRQLLVEFTSFPTRQ
jgi:hypothetical protein